MSASYLIPLIFLSLSFPLLVLQKNTYTGQVIGSPDNRFALAFYLIMFCVVVSKMKSGSNFKIKLHGSDVVLVAFTAFTMIQAIFLVDVSILVNLIAFLLIGFSIRYASCEPDYRRFLSISSICLVGFLIFLRVYYGEPNGRWFGGIHPNVIAGYAFAATALAAIGNPKILDLVAFLSLSFSIIVSSRYAIISVSMVYIVFWIINIRLCSPERITVLSLLVLIMISFELISSGGGIVSNILELNDADRGLGSGFTGRDQHWANFIPQISHSPEFGYGFRNRDAYDGAHNGFLDIYLQSGIAGGTLMLLFFVWRLVHSIKLVSISDRYSYRGGECAAFIALFFSAMLQPQLFSFGEAFGLTSLILAFGSSEAKL